VSVRSNSNMTTKKKVIFAVSLIYLSLFGLTGLVATISYQSFRNMNIDLALADKYKGNVVFKGTTTKKSKYVTKQAEYLILQGNAQEFGLFDSNVFDKVNEGDNLEFYYKKSNEEMNLTIYQIKKDGQVIRDKKEYEATEKNVFYLTLLGSVFMLGVIGWSMTTIRFDKFREL
jgi:hypothetical protein